MRRRKRPPLALHGATVPGLTAVGRRVTNAGCLSVCLSVWGYAEEHVPSGGDGSGPRLPAPLARGGRTDRRGRSSQQPARLGTDRLRAHLRAREYGGRLQCDPSQGQVGTDGPGRGEGRCSMPRAAPAPATAGTKHEAACTPDRLEFRKFDCLGSLILGFQHFCTRLYIGVFC